MFISANNTPYLAEAFTALDKTCVKSFVVVVRATYDVDNDGNCTISDSQSPFVYADAHYGDPETTCVRAESDFVPFKPRAEVLLDAFAIVPGKDSAESLEVALLGSSLNKRAIVTGERRWIRGVSGMRWTQPTQFSALPLAWHLSFGGTDSTFGDEARTPCDPRNPVGRGFQENSNPEAIEGQLLPSIEHPESRMASWNDRPEPIGFGPVPRFAASRAGYAGTYNEQWMADVLPFLPSDFDDRYFLAAPPDQQLDTLAEGASFACLNMNDSGRFRVRLPQLSVPISFIFDDHIRAPTVIPDTLILQPHESRVVLLGRARTPLPRKFTRLREVVVGQRRATAATHARVEA